MGKSLIRIDRVERHEIGLLAKIGRQTFAETFASSNDADDFESYLDTAFTTDQLTSEFSEEHSAFFFARIDSEIAGYIKLNTGAAQTEKVEGDALEIERIYVTAQFQGAGVGKAMFDFASQIAKEQSRDAIWLGVWEDNPKAIAFYERQGFEVFGEHVFKLGSDQQRDIMMRLDF